MRFKAITSIGVLVGAMVMAGCSDQSSEDIANLGKAYDTIEALADMADAMEEAEESRSDVDGLTPEDRMQALGDEWDVLVEQYDNLMFHPLQQKIVEFDNAGNEVLATHKFVMDVETHEKLLSKMKEVHAYNVTEIDRIKPLLDETDFVENPALKESLDRKSLDMGEAFIAHFASLDAKQQENQKDLLMMVRGLYPSKTMISPNHKSADIFVTVYSYMQLKSMMNSPEFKALESLSKG
ncbi:hypothetical protein A9Q99_10345 [Gammaproteobacteria bacterium 45_16_T64]|nr:hypothetical protein A9Q99_10345 [Gammaproteobacteria bacterium 45_16_T64]